MQGLSALQYVLGLAQLSPPTSNVVVGMPTLSTPSPRHYQAPGH